MKYEGGLDNRGSLDSDDLAVQVRGGPAAMDRTVDIADGPIRDSAEEPMPKNRKKTNGKSQVGAMQQASIESFGAKNAMSMGSSGGGAKVKRAKDRQPIEENFLENDEESEDYTDSFDKQF